MAKMACASHILLDTEKQAQIIKNKLDKAANFAQLAKQYSKCPSSKKGGDLGEFRQFDKAVFANGSEDKKYLGPIKTKFGFHLIQVLYKT